MLTVEKNNKNIKVKGRLLRRVLLLFSLKSLIRPSPNELSSLWRSLSICHWILRLLFLDRGNSRRKSFDCPELLTLHQPENLVARARISYGLHKLNSKLQEINQKRAMCFDMHLGSQAQKRLLAFITTSINLQLKSDELKT